MLQTVMNMAAMTGPNNEPVEAGDRDTAERRNQDQRIGHFGFSADEDRTQHIVDRADDEGTARNQDQPFRYRSGEKKVQRNRNPDYSRPHRGNQRHRAHERAPQGRYRTTQQREHYAPTHSLSHGDAKTSIETRPDDLDETLAQALIELRSDPQ